MTRAEGGGRRVERGGDTGGDGGLNAQWKAALRRFLLSQRVLGSDMKLHINEKNYVFDVVAEGRAFSIKATHKTTRRFSYINNTNIVLSNLGVDASGSSNSESQWDVPPQKAACFFNAVKSMIRDVSFRNRLEREMDRDREYGEWENIEKGGSH